MNDEPEVTPSQPRGDWAELIAAAKPLVHYFELNDLADRSDSDAIEVPVGDLRRLADALSSAPPPSTGTELRSARSNSPETGVRKRDGEGGGAAGETAPAPSGFFEALERLVYETTHLSAEEDDGSHWCKISKAALTAARRALAASNPGGGVRW